MNFVPGQVFDIVNSQPYVIRIILATHLLLAGTMWVFVATAFRFSYLHFIPLELQSVDSSYW